MDILDVSKKERRFFRVPLSLPAAVENVQNQSLSGVLIGDMSAGGIRLLVWKFIPIQSTLRIDLMLNGQMWSGIACVMWCQKDRFSDRYTVGLEWSENQNSIHRLKTITSFCDNIRWQIAKQRVPNG